MARTRKVWAPSASGAVVCGDAQLTKLPPSIAHWNVDPVSVEWKPKVGVESVVVPDWTGVDDGSGGSVVGDAVIAGEREALGEGIELGAVDRPARSGRDDPAVGLDRERKSGVVLAESR